MNALKSEIKFMKLQKSILGRTGGVLYAIIHQDLDGAVLNAMNLYQIQLLQPDYHIRMSKIVQQQPQNGMIQT